jgi:hypothetical protein
VTPDEVYDNLGESTEWDLLVARIRDMHDPEREHELHLAESKGYDRGWLAGIDFAMQQSREETRAIRRRHIERLSCTYRHWRRTFLEESACCVLLLFVPLIAIWLLKGG